MQKNQLAIYCNERKILRNELDNLKNCQVTFFATSVTATALILTVAAKISPDSLPGIAYLFPLAILIPTWTVFFDKALTISRIVGYYRVLEQLIVDEEFGTSIDFMGWETSLKKFRDYEIKDPNFSEIIVDLGQNFQWTNRYWKLINYAYNGLIYACFILSVSALALAGPNTSLETLVYFIILISAFIISFKVYLKNSAVLDDLQKIHSYDFNEAIWRKVLEKKQNPS